MAPQYDEDITAMRSAESDPLSVPKGASHVASPCSQPVAQQSTSAIAPRN